MATLRIRLLSLVALFTVATTHIQALYSTVMDENRRLSSSPEGLRDLEAMVLRDRNHPSVFMWSLENEEDIQYGRASTTEAR